MQLDDWQEQILNDESKYILLCKGRQIGGTTIFAEKSFKWMVEKGARILVGSITEDQAKLVIVMVYELLSKNKQTLKMIKKGKDKPTQDRIRLTNGAEIRSRAVGTMGDGFRGFTADVNWLNEGASWSELAIISIMPTLLTTGGSIWVDSTPKGMYLPNGEKRWFYRAYENKGGRWKVYYKNSRDVILNRKINDEWTIQRREASLKLLDDQEQEMSQLMFGQEYLGLFQEELLNFFPDELIEKLCILDKIPKTNEDHYLGADIGVKEDPTIITIGRRKGDKLFQTELITMKPNGKEIYTTQITDRILQEKRLWDTSKEFIDGGGVGFGVYSELMNSEARNSVVDLNSSSKSVSKDGKKQKKILQTDMYYNLKVLMERRNIYFLKDDELKASLRGIQREVDREGREFFRGRNNHITESLVRLAWCMQRKDLNLMVYTIKV